MTDHAAVRVAIVDDDIWVRTGRAAALSTAGLDVVASVTHEEALEVGRSWAGIDVMVVDAWDARAAFDKFPGVRVVQSVRQQRSPSQTRIVIITGHVFNELLRCRMADAGADELYGHDDVADVPSLVAVVRGLTKARPQTTTGAGNPAAALDWLSKSGYEDAFNGESQKMLNASRRAIMRIRREVGNRAGLGAESNGGPQRASTGPTWRQVVRYVDRARGADPG